MELFHNSLVV